MATLEELDADVIACRRCPRLVEWREQVARVKTRAYRSETYWGKPLPGFGDPAARLLIIGLAPAAHGGNRTGRMFTGDSSADSLFIALLHAGFANQSTSRRRDDGLILSDAYITAAGRCAPPDNHPTPDELRNCRPFLERNIRLLPNVRIVVALGQIAFSAYLRTVPALGLIPPRPLPPFGHRLEYRFGPGWPVVLTSYHPSRQNTQTGRLTQQMLDDVFHQARAILGE